MQQVDAYIRWYNERRIKLSLGQSAPKCTANSAGWNDKAVQKIVRIPKMANNLGVDSKDVLTTMNKVNVGELTLRGVCVSKD